MDPITFRLTRFQRRRHLVVVAICAVVVAVLGLLGVSGGLDQRGMVVLVFVILLAGTGVALAGRIWGRAAFDQQGIKTRYLGRARRVAWSAVSDIDVVMDSAPRGRHFDERVRIRLTDGTSFKLPAPYQSTLFGRDPKFDVKLEHIKGRWRSAAEPVGLGQSR